MTSLGNTSSQSELYPITQSKEQAKNRFLWNLEINKYEVQQLAISLEKQFAAKWATVTLLDKNDNITFNNVKQLLEWKEIILDSWQKISIELDWVFYLLGECCNESIGIDIKKIKITVLKKEIVLPGKYTAEWIPEKIYEYPTYISTKSHSIASRVKSKEVQVSWKYHRAKHEKPTADGTAWEDKKPGIVDTPENGGGWEIKDPGNIEVWEYSEDE